MAALLKVSRVVTLSFIYGAYFTETFRGAFQAVPAGQIEAARAYGMSRFTFYRWIILPSALLVAQRVFETVFGGEPQVAAIRANDFDERFSCKSPIVSLINRVG